MQLSVPATVLMRSVLYTGLVGGDGLFPLPFPRCVREPAVNVAGTEVIVTLIVIILVLALVAGFLGYQWRMQIDRTNSATSMIKQVNSERRAMHATATEEEAAENLVYPEEATEAESSSKGRGVTSIWPESQEQQRLKSISD